MHVTLWVLQGVLAGAFLAVGTAKLALPREALAGQMGWVEDYGQGQIRLISAAELLGAIGVVLPAAVGVVSVLSGIAALCLAVLMAGAIQTHIRRQERIEMAPSAVLFVLTLIVAAGRLSAWTF
jgi:hypothetical protein